MQPRQFLCRLALFSLHLALLAIGAASTRAQQGPALYPGRLLPLAGAPRELLAADLNADGRKDLIAAGGPVSVLLAQSGAGLGQPQTSAIDGYAFDAVAGDLNGDGKLDVTAIHANNSFASVLLGNGAGALGPGQTFDVGADAVGAALGDVNGDGKLDLVTANGGYMSFSRLLGDGLGALSSPQLSLMPFDPSALALGDLDLDGDLDLAACSGSESSTYVLTNDGQGGWAPFAEIASSPASSIALGDLDDDGRLDAVAGSNTSNVILYLHNTGTGFSATYILVAGIVPNEVGLGELDEDGRLDLVVTDSNQGWLVVLLGTSTSPAEAGTFPVGLGSAAVLIAELTGDGKADVASGNELQNGINLLAGDGSGQVQASIATNLATGNAYGWGAVLADVNSDGRSDLAASGYLPGDVRLMLGDGSGNFGTPSVYPSASSITGLALGDLDGNGALDLVFCNESGGPVSGTLGVRLGDGAGAFGAQSLYPASDASHFPYELALSDFDLDGRLDAAVAIAGGGINNLAVLYGGPGGALGPPAYLGAINPHDLAVGDLNADGRPDLAAANVGGLVVLHLGLGSGAFGTLPGIAVGEQIESLALGELDGDGKLDLAVGGIDHLKIYGGDGFGGFAALASLADSYFHLSLAIADLDGGGANDVVYERGNAASLGVLLGSGVGSFAPLQAYAAQLGGHGYGLGDIDSNGRLDIVSVHYHGSLDLASVLANELALPAGISPYSSGTPGCSGGICMGANAAPQIGASGFMLTCANAPPLTKGIGVLGTAFSYPGVDPFGLGVKLHVNPLTSTALVLFPFKSDLAGLGKAPLPIPTDAGLLSLSLYAQSLWIEPPGYSCSTSPLPLASSKGLAITIQP